MGAVETYHVVGILAALTVGFVAIRALQGAVEHYAPNSEPAVVLRWIYGGP